MSDPRTGAPAYAGPKDRSVVSIFYGGGKELLWPRRSRRDTLTLVARRGVSVSVVAQALMVYTATLGAFRWAQVKEETRDASPDTRERVVHGEKALGFDDGFDKGVAQGA